MLLALAHLLLERLHVLLALAHLLLERLHVLLTLAEDVPSRRHEYECRWSVLRLLGANGEEEVSALRIAFPAAEPRSHVFFLRRDERDRVGMILQKQQDMGEALLKFRFELAVVELVDVEGVGFLP